MNSVKIVETFMKTNAGSVVTYAQFLGLKEKHYQVQMQCADVKSLLNMCLRKEYAEEQTLVSVGVNASPKDALFRIQLMIHWVKNQPKKLVGAKTGTESFRKVWKPS